MRTGQDDRVTIGKIERPFGVRGEVKVRSFSDAPGRFDRLDQVRVVRVTGQAVEATVTNVRRAGGTYIVRFEGISTPEEAGTLRGGLIQVSHGTAPALPDGQFYECDLIGMSVVNEQGEDVGLLETVWDLPGHHVFVVRKGTQEILIPAAKAFIASVDCANRRMVVRAVEGLSEEQHAL